MKVEKFPTMLQTVDNTFCTDIGLTPDMIDKASKHLQKNFPKEEVVMSEIPSFEIPNPELNVVLEAAPTIESNIIGDVQTENNDATVNNEINEPAQTQITPSQGFESTNVNLEEKAEVKPESSNITNDFTAIATAFINLGETSKKQEGSIAQLNNALVELEIQINDLATRIAKLENLN